MAGETEPFPGEQNRLYLSRPGGGWRDATSELPRLSDFSHSAAIGDMPAGCTSNRAATRGMATQAPWAFWVDVLDFNGDGAADFVMRRRRTRVA